ncbi:dihydrodipicolinate reductase C-terminal domain-containing protein [Botrimarina hoheduenensis]|uniref:4-hydroxy-tetrahydrodipicolinate reductase n=1 Tax=Botrimarina hoheduenensis TaxID=2528000 RepID=A0A5C5W8P3_9BACT|nr:dihydrodipicolinate reductase C-terminal domain-containing protein [Botrimarina hoheduenensis]TWT46633.1 4-hydroxy-tetrahydrodipicolinate reductase [Botrimarina hoheduenensis]
MTPILISGLPGAMALETARLVAESADLALTPFALTSAKHDSESLLIGAEKLRLVECKHVAPADLSADVVAVDYSTPEAALENLAWFVRQGLPVVVGTTGFDREEAIRLVREAGGLAVIAPNMAIPIVLLQAAARYLAETFPGALAGAELTIRESHQAHKRDTSGTAKALVAAAQTLGFGFTVEQIESIRDPARQSNELGVPDEHLDGHALHRYDARCAGGTVQLVLEHNVLGRRVYAEGTLRAIRFLIARRKADVRGQVFCMEDVLRG